MAPKEATARLPVSSSNALAIACMGAVKLAATATCTSPASAGAASRVAARAHSVGMARIFMELCLCGEKVRAPVAAGPHSAQQSVM
ncbi:Uncharacterised protein [Bordetella pertussis]|nr:Uncharacterised protein [Bordetella pertussis]